MKKTLICAVTLVCLLTGSLPMAFADYQDDYDALYDYASESFKTLDDGSKTDEEMFATYKTLIEAKLNYIQPGTQVTIADGKVGFVVPEGFTFIAKGEALFMFQMSQDKMDLTKEEKETIQGILVYNGSFYDKESLWVLVKYTDDGYTSDHDADTINVDELIADYNKQTEKENKKAGPDETKFMNTVWLTKPVYDKTNHLFSFTRYFDEVVGEENLGTTVNSNLQIFGRFGTLDLVVVAGKEQLDSVPKVIKILEDTVRFTSGSSYADYNPDTDKKSDYTVAGVIAGAVGVKLLAKAGFWAIILKFGKGILIAVIVFFKKIKEKVVSLFNKSSK